MESFFELAFPDVNFDLEKDTKVCCPFPHKYTDGTEYYEENPSMSINVDKGIYHCFSCGAKGNEINFIAHMLKVDYVDAEQFKDALSKANETVEDWERSQKTLKANPQLIDLLTQGYKFSHSAIQKLKLGVEGVGKGISFPVFLYGKLIDTISYDPTRTPKYKKRYNTPTGLIMPYDTWKTENLNKRTIIVAGQKDLGIATTYNFNAIAITGGEGTIPKYFLHDFKDRNVSIVYDNDDAGKTGARKVATAIAPYVSSVNIIDLSNVCQEKGEDLWDYFVKYKKSREDLVQLIKNTPDFTKEEYEEELDKQIPTVKLDQAVKSNYYGKLLRSNVQVIGADQESYLMDTAITAEASKDDRVFWQYSPKRPEQLFYLVGGNLNDTQIFKNTLQIMGIPKDIKVKLKVTKRTPIYKASVSDYVEASSLDDKVTEYNVYSVGHHLESGKRYRITYKLVPHPLQGKTLYLVIFDVENSQDSVTNFTITEPIKERLREFQVQHSLTETINSHINKVKGILNADYDELLIRLIDFWYHTPLEFNVNRFKNLRAYLDMLIIAESRVGKSSTVQALQRTYGLGTRIPLNGSNATIAGIIGGSHKTKNGYQVRAGAIPRAHKGAVIFEELMKAKQDILTELTEVRSSHQVILTRVSGSINLPAYVRQLTLTNAKMDGGEPRPINSYPNGIEIVTDLVGTAEDIARYDVIAVLSRRGASYIDAYFEPPQPFPTQYYQDRIRWIWSRKQDQVIIDDEVYTHTIETANEINKEYDSYIKLFSTEAWLKIIRLAIAVAGYVVSTDDNFENIIVKKEHVDYAAKMLVKLYDNKTFRFKEYVQQERDYTTLKEGDVETLQKLWKDNQGLLMYLENHSKINQRTLQSISGLDMQGFSSVLNVLVSKFFIKMTANDVIPVEKYRIAMKEIDRTVNIRTISI